MCWGNPEVLRGTPAWREGVGDEDCSLIMNEQRCAFANDRYPSAWNEHVSQDALGLATWCRLARGCALGRRLLILRLLTSYCHRLARQTDLGFGRWAAQIARALGLLLTIQ
jgi:hypothetical protein